MLKTAFATAVLLLLTTTTSSASSECEALKDQVANPTLTDVNKTQLLDNLRRLVAADDLCGKNLLGRLTYQGKLLPEDTDKAYAIFYDLANKGYPPAMYNMAYFYIEQNTLPPEGILDLLKGIMARFAGNPEWGVIAADARELGWEYLNTQLLQDRNSPHLRALEQSFGEMSNATILRAAQIAVGTRDSYHAAGNVIIGLMALGAAASIASNAMSAPATTYSSSYTIPPPSPRYFSLMSTPTPGTYYLYGF